MVGLQSLPKGFLLGLKGSRPRPSWFRGPKGWRWPEETNVSEELCGWGLSSGHRAFFFKGLRAMKGFER